MAKEAMNKMKGHPVPSRFTPWLLHLLMVLPGLMCAKSSCYWCWWKTSWIRPKGSAKDCSLSCPDTLLFLLGSSYGAECPRAQKIPSGGSFWGPACSFMHDSCFSSSCLIPSAFLGHQPGTGGFGKQEGIELGLEMQGSTSREEEGGHVRWEGVRSEGNIGLCKVWWNRPFTVWIMATF